MPGLGSDCEPRSLSRTDADNWAAAVPPNEYDFGPMPFSERNKNNIGFYICLSLEQCFVLSCLWFCFVLTVDLKVLCTSLCAAGNFDFCPGHRWNLRRSSTVCNRVQTLSKTKVNITIIYLNKSITRNLKIEMPNLPCVLFMFFLFTFFLHFIQTSMTVY